LLLKKKIFINIIKKNDFNKREASKLQRFKEEEILAKPKK